MHLTPAERAAAEAYLARLTENVRDLAGRLERLRADLREPAPPPRLSVLSGVRPEHPIQDTSQSGVTNEES